MTRLFALLLGLLALPALAATPITSLQIPPSPDGKTYSRFINGEGPPDVAELAWDNDALNALLATALTHTVGDAAVSVDVRSALLGTERLTANIVLTQKTGTSITGYFTEPLLTNNLVFDCDAGVAGGTWRVRAVGTTGGVASDAQFTWACLASGSSSRSFHPGIYWQGSRSGLPLDPAYRRDVLYPAIFTNGNSAFKGFALPIRWRDIELVQGNVNPGVTLIFNEIDVLSALNPPRRLWIQMEDDKQRGTAASEFPDYLNAMGAVYTKLGGVSGNIPTVYWDQGSAAALAAHQTMWTNFITALKADPTRWAMIEGFRLTQEYGNDEWGGSGPVSQAEYDAYMRYYVSLIRSLAPDKAIIVNYVSGALNSCSFLDHVDDEGALPGHGDTLPCKANGDTDSCGPDDGLTFNSIMPTVDKVLIGTSDCASGQRTDRRATSAIWMAAEGSELGQCAFETYSLQDIYDYVNDPMQAVYFLIDTTEADGGGSACDASDAANASNRAAIKAFFEANPTLDNTSTPNNYP